MDLQFIPLSSNHASNPVLSSDRVILLMGDIHLANFGNTSAVLFDGKSFTPYILSTKANGSNGIIYTLFSQRTQSFSSHGTPPLYPFPVNPVSETSADMVLRTCGVRLGDCDFPCHLTILNSPPGRRWYHRSANPSTKRRLCPCPRNSANWGRNA